MKDKKNKLILSLIASATLFMSGCGDCKKSNKQEAPYEAQWSSLVRHRMPQWLMDMKFGIYSHWGPQSAMLEKINASGEKNYTLNEENIEEAFKAWTGEKFSAKEWVKFFKDSGAQFAGPVVMHGTGCVNWDSAITSWNSAKKGPKVDILGELAKEVHANDMKLIATFHNVRLKGIWGEISKEDRTFVEPTYDDTNIRTDKRWLQGWLDRAVEAVTKYNIDIAWFDTSFGGSVGPELKGDVKGGKYNPKTKPLAAKKGDNSFGGISEKYQRKFMAEYFNDAMKKGKEVEVMFKSNDIPVNIGMKDIENGNLENLQYDPWVSDVNMMHHVKSWDWFYDERNPLKDANCLVDMLVDMTSKNGRLLLNVPPHSDGSFPEPVKKELLAMGEWLKVNGEGIYSTTPWTIYGEGPTFIKNEGHHGQGKHGGKEMANFGAEDIRYTTKGNCIYAFVLGWPESGEIDFKSLGFERKLYIDEIKNVSMLGTDEKIHWQHKEYSLNVKFPTKKVGDFAYCFKIELK